VVPRDPTNRAVPVFRAPMRARDRDLPSGAGADFGVEHGVVGIGDALASEPESLGDAIDAAGREHGAKAARMLRAFAAVPDGAFVWTRESDGTYRLGRFCGPWRYETSTAAVAVGIHHVRPATWAPESLHLAQVPASVAATFARGGRNFQRTHGADVERATAALWAGGPAAQ
jgi:hypothetical protein